MTSKKQARRTIQASKRERWAKKSGAFESARLAALLVAESGQARQFVHPATV